MAVSKQYYELLPTGTNVPAGTTRVAPVTGPVVDMRTFLGGELVYRISNGGALGAPCTIMLQVSPDGANWFDYDQASSGDLAAGTVVQGPSIPLGRGGMYVRAIAFGNTTNACTVEAGAMMVKSL